VWRLKFLIIGMIPSAVLGVALYLLAPEMADALRDKIRDSAADAVETAFQREAPEFVQPGQIVITEDQLLTAVEDADDRERTWNIDGLGVVIADGRVSFTDDDRDSSSRDTAIASAVPEIQNGRLVLTDRRGVLSIFKPARDAIADEIEDQAALIFQNSEVRPVSVTADNGQLVIVTESIGEAAGTPVTSNATPAAEPTTSGGLFGLPSNRTPTATP
jgi:hypothetical protein